MQGCDLRLDAGVSVDSRKEFSRGDGRGWATVDEEASKSFRGIGISLGTMHAGIADVWRNGNFWRAHCN